MAIPPVSLQRKGSDPRLEDWLSGNDSLYRERAEEALRQMGPDTARVWLLSIHDREDIRWRRRRQMRMQIPLVIALLILLSAVFIQGRIAITSVLLALATLQCLFALAVSTGFGIRTTRLHRHVISVLARLDDKRLIPPLTDALAYTEDRKPLVTALTRLLPRMEAGDALLLNERQRSQLCQALNPAFSDQEHIADFQIAILSALGHVGDEKALRSVAKMAHGPANTPGQQRVQEAARACLSALQDRTVPQAAE